MTQQTDAEFIAEMKALAKEATKQVEAYGASAPLLKFANAARTAIPRLIGMVEAEKKRADDAEAWASCCQQDRDLANDTLYNAVSHEEKAATERNAEIAERICIERNDAQAERDTALASEAELRERISRLHIRGGHQSWCALFGETVDWDDELIHRIEPFVIKLIEEIQDELTRPFNGREREIFKTKVRRALDAETERDAALAEIEKLNAAITTLTRKLEGAKAETESSRVTAVESVKNADRWRIAHDRIEEENFALAANQCHAGYSDEGGSHRCREVDAAIETKGRFDTPDENGCWYGVEKCTLPHCDCEKLTAVLASRNEP